ncbi:MAG: type II toxin-antitoxin system VapC family toxin [Candidatus Bathyarchaeia archaeon]
MASPKRLSTLDANVLVAALKGDEPYSEKCARILERVPDELILVEPSIVYQEVCGALARRAGPEVAREAGEILDGIIHPRLLINCDRDFCLSAWPLCHRFGIYAIDALYLKAALDREAMFISLDKEGLIDRIRGKDPAIEAYHVSEL